MDAKSTSASLSVLAQMVLPSQANPAGNIHGGEMMKMMDSAASIAAQRHALANVVTARVDELQFRKPVYVGDLVTCTSQVIFAGNCSMEVIVCVEAENPASGNGSKIALTAFFTMVALDSDGHPKQVAPVDPGSDPYNIKMYEAGKARYMENKARQHKRK